MNPTWMACCSCGATIMPANRSKMLEFLDQHWEHDVLVTNRELPPLSSITGTVAFLAGNDDLTNDDDLTDEVFVWGADGIDHLTDLLHPFAGKHVRVMVVEVPE